MTDLRQRLAMIAALGVAAGAIAACSMTPPAMQQTAQADRPYPPGYYGTPYHEEHSPNYYRPTAYYNRPTDYGWDQSNTYHREHD